MQMHFEKATLISADFVAFLAIRKKCEKLQSQFQNNRFLKLALMSYFAYVGFFLFLISPAVIIQEHVEPDVLGRVFSVLTMQFTSILPLALLLFGPVVESSTGNDPPDAQHGLCGCLQVLQGYRQGNSDKVGVEAETFCGKALHAVRPAASLSL
ncbi:MAG: hypothetical protein ABIJ86_05960 [Spirochaetota bacterium]